MTRSAWVALLASASLGLFAACGSGGGGGGGSGGQPGVDAGGAATFAQVYSTLSASCAIQGCHAGSNAPGGLDMSSAQLAYTNLVGVKAAGPACGSSGMTRVVPGDSSHSLLYLKVNPGPPCGSQMPLDHPPLSSDAIGQIKSWIDAGAQSGGVSGGSSSGAGGSGSSGSGSGSGGSGSGSGSGTSSSGSSGSSSGSSSSGSSSGSSTSSSGGSSGGWSAYVGPKGVFGQTFDEVHWSARVVATQDLASVTCVNDQDGWVAGAAGFVAHTTDGGQTWSPQSSGVSADLYAIRFRTLDFGVAAGAGGTLLLTGDGGAHWGPAAIPTQATLRGAATAGSYVVVAGDGGTIVRSTDGGASWSLTTVAQASDLHAVAVDPYGHLTLAVDAAGGVWRSDDLGASFVREAALGVALDAVDLSGDDASAIAAGAGGALFARDAQGVWHVASSPTTAGLHAALIGPTGYFAGGDAGTLLTSHDQGMTWSPVASGTTASIRALDDF
jgi:photosystem II stability/assembly factor-like uncharacterized protein